MKLKAYDKVRKQYIPPENFALSGDGHILILSDRYDPLLYPPGVPADTAFIPSDEVLDESVEVTVEDA